MLIRLTKKLDSSTILVSTDEIRYVESLKRGTGNWSRIILKGGKGFEVKEDINEVEKRCYPIINLQSGIKDESRLS